MVVEQMLQNHAIVTSNHNWLHLTLEQSWNGVYSQ